MKLIYDQTLSWLKFSRVSICICWRGVDDKLVKRKSTAQGVVTAPLFEPYNEPRLWHPTGNAGFRLHFPTRFEVFGDRGVSQQDTEGAPNGMEPLPQQGPVAHSTEARIGQKLQLIGDQFHLERVQLVSSNCATCWLLKLSLTRAPANSLNLLRRFWPLFLVSGSVWGTEL